MSQTSGMSGVAIPFAASLECSMSRGWGLRTVCCEFLVLSSLARIDYHRLRTRRALQRCSTMFCWETEGRYRHVLLVLNGTSLNNDNALLTKPYSTFPERMVMLFSPICFSKGIVSGDHQFIKSGTHSKMEWNSLQNSAWLYSFAMNYTILSQKNHLLIQWGFYSFNWESMKCRKPN